MIEPTDGLGSCVFYGDDSIVVYLLFAYSIILIHMFMICVHIYKCIKAMSAMHNNQTRSMTLATWLFYIAYLNFTITNCRQLA